MGVDAVWRLFAVISFLALASCAHGLRPGETFRDCADCPELVVIPAGAFTLGTHFPELADHARLRIGFTRDFAVGRFEVTNDQYAAFVRATGRTTDDYCSNSLGPAATTPFEQAGNHPVVCVSWDDAQAYVQWLNTQTPGGYRLLSLTEWEYAARAGGLGAYPWGDSASHEAANYGADACCEGLASGRDQWVNTSPVGMFGANAFGLYDMAGNAWEWTQECFGYDLYSVTVDGSARDYPDCQWRMARGGGWESDPEKLNFSGYDQFPPSMRLDNLGFRVARTLHADADLPQSQAFNASSGGALMTQSIADRLCPVIAYAVRGRWNGLWNNEGLQHPVCYIVGARRVGPLAETADIEAGLIAGQTDAEERCALVASVLRANWTGQWRTTRPGRMSVCTMTLSPAELACYRSDDGGASWRQEHGLREAQCFQRDFCSGGLGQLTSSEGRPCYKWALSAGAPALRWTASLIDPPLRGADIPPPQEIYEGSFEQTSDDDDTNPRLRMSIDTPIHASTDAASPIVALIPADECVQPGDYRLLSAPRRGVVIETIGQFAAGDVIYRLAYDGEGAFSIWRRGETLYATDDDVVVRWDAPSEPLDSRVGYWLHVTRADGVSGWVRDPQTQQCDVGVE
ncbi:MAG: SUMF1/EgtB/PvdO family nonheme iron enzyme [Hyphomonadaceae bacterium]